MKKKVTFVSKPGSEDNKATTPDDWVGLANKPEPGEPTKRLTIDIPVSLHQRFKSRCAIEDLRMADVVRQLIEDRFPENPGE